MDFKIDKHSVDEQWAVDMYRTCTLVEDSSRRQARVASNFLKHLAQPTSSFYTSSSPSPSSLGPTWNGPLPTSASTQVHRKPGHLGRCWWRGTGREAREEGGGREFIRNRKEEEEEDRRRRRRRRRRRAFIYSEEVRMKMKAEAG